MLFNTNPGMCQSITNSRHAYSVNTLIKALFNMLLKSTQNDTKLDTILIVINI